MHYYKRNLGDYAKKAGRLSMLQHGAYTLLIDACYDREQFPTMAEAIDWTWASSAAEIEAVEFVLTKFFTLEDGRYTQTRIQEELNDYRTKAETNARIALEREAKRKEALANRERTVNEPSPNHKPITNNQEPIEDQKPLSPDDDEKPANKIPYQQIADLYNRVCGDVLPKCVALNDKRRASIRGLWNMSINGVKPFRDLEFWEGYFNDCLTNKHWTGGNDRGWRADIDFLTTQKAALKALEAA